MSRKVVGCSSTSRRANPEALCQGRGRQAHQRVLQPEGLWCLRIPSLCTAGKQKRLQRWEHEAVLDEMERRFEAMPNVMAVRRCTVEHVFGTIKGWMGATHFATRGPKNVATEASLTILVYNIKRAVAVSGVAPTLKAITE